MSSNERITKLRLVDKQFKLHQLSAKLRKSTKQLPRKIDRLKIVSQDTKKAA